MGSRYADVPDYSDRRWRALRLAVLADDPLCALCRELGHLTPATVVDHITPHKGDPDLFWDRDNLRGLCKPCHDGAKQSQDRTGKLRGCNGDGKPLDPSHPWNKR